MPFFARDQYSAASGAVLLLLTEEPTNKAPDVHVGSPWRERSVDGVASRVAP
jgi:hypothetical protein